MKTILKIVAVFMLAMNGQAQQLPIFNQHFSNPEIFNPSALAMGDRINASTIYKQYLTGFTGNPRTTFFHVSGPIKSDKLAVGLNLYNDGLGITNKFGIYGSLAYRVKFAKKHDLTFGLSLGMLQYSFEPDEVIADNMDDPLFVNKNFNSSGLDGAFGLTYRLKNLQVGLGINQLFGMEQRLQEDVAFTQDRSYYAQASYKFFVDAEDRFSIMPVVMTRFATNDIPHEGGLVLGYKNDVWLGASYKTSKAIAITGGVRILENLRIGYSYETGAMNAAQTYQSGSHEVMLSYSFGIVSRMLEKQQEQIDELDEKLDISIDLQNKKDYYQNEAIKNNQEQIDSNKAAIEKLDKELEETQQQLEDLKNELIEAGVLKRVNAEDFDTDEKGYYVVISSINDRNYSESAMEEKYLSKGFKKLYNEKTGWHYVYQVSTDDLQEALIELKKARKEINNKAWIYILE